MTVKELMENLAQFPPEHRVMVSVDGGPDHPIIDNVEENEHGVWIIVLPEAVEWTS